MTSPRVGGVISGGFTTGLVTAPVLAIPRGNEGFVVDSDASGKGFVCILMQKGRVIAYASR